MRGDNNSHVTDALHLTRHFHVFLVTQACKTIYGTPSGSWALPKPGMKPSHLVLLPQGPERSLGWASKRIISPGASWQDAVMVPSAMDPMWGTGLLTDIFIFALSFQTAATVDLARQNWAHLIWKPGKCKDHQVGNEVQGEKGTDYKTEQRRLPEGQPNQKGHSALSGTLAEGTPYPHPMRQTDQKKKKKSQLLFLILQQI